MKNEHRFVPIEFRSAYEAVAHPISHIPTHRVRQEYAKILSRLAEFISDLPLSIADMEELGADIEAIKTQIQTANPKQSIVKACLGSIRSSLEVISAKAVANGV
jgi:hypothetical protein